MRRICRNCRNNVNGFCEKWGLAIEKNREKGCDLWLPWLIPDQDELIEILKEDYEEIQYLIYETEKNPCIGESAKDAMKAFWQGAATQCQRTLEYLGVEEKEIREIDHRVWRR